MPLVKFMDRFETRIYQGAKVTTIRQTRKHPFKLGDRLYMYTGPRFKPRKIGESDVHMVGDISIDFENDVISILWATDGHEGFMSTITAKDGLDAFAFNDGFDTWLDLKLFFLATHNGKELFSGQIVRWKDFVRERPQPEFVPKNDKAPEG